MEGVCGIRLGAETALVELVVRQRKLSRTIIDPHLLRVWTGWDLADCTTVALLVLELALFPLGPMLAPFLLRRLVFSTSVRATTSHANQLLVGTGQRWI